jgi:hypothetical protein
VGLKWRSSAPAADFARSIRGGAALNAALLRQELRPAAETLAAATGAAPVIIKGPVLPGQRSAIVHFESPQTNEKFPIEVRYPTGNRGGFLAGFAEFFQEHLVPGAFLTIEATDEPGNYTIEFLTVSGQDRKLLVLDEKRNEYKFESVTFYCAPNEDMLLAENRFPKLAGTSPLDERSRRQPELVIAKAFEHVGERVDANGDGQLMAVMDELVGAANIERPVPAIVEPALRASAQAALTANKRYSGGKAHRRKPPPRGCSVDHGDRTVQDRPGGSHVLAEQCGPENIQGVVHRCGRKPGVVPTIPQEPNQLFSPAAHERDVALDSLPRE